LSGDEFVAVLPQCDAEHVANTIERLQELLAEPLNIADTSLAISASVGIAMFPMDGRDMETLVHRADMAMYQAKSKGRGRFCFFSSEMNRLAQERLAWRLHCARRSKAAACACTISLRSKWPPAVCMAWRPWRAGPMQSWARFRLPALSRWPKSAG
jgi:predicted signal transduction protein with EAL and GGDEF domain